MYKCIYSLHRSYFPSPYIRKIPFNIPFYSPFPHSSTFFPAPRILPNNMNVKKQFNNKNILKPSDLYVNPIDPQSYTKFILDLFSRKISKSFRLICSFSSRFLEVFVKFIFPRELQGSNLYMIS